MLDNWFDFEKIDDYAGDLSRAAYVIADAWKVIVISMGLISLSGGLFLVGYAAWKGRDALASVVYHTLSGSATSPVSLTPWSMLPPEQFPEFWHCSAKGCVADTEKQLAVLELLDNIRYEAKGIRVTFSVYGPTFRRVAAQSVSINEREIPPELWVVPLSQPGYKQNVAAHSYGHCKEIIVSQLPEGSILRVEAPLYNTQKIVNCPVDKRDREFSPVGYVSVDLNSRSPYYDSTDRVRSILISNIEKLEQVMGYDG